MLGLVVLLVIGLYLLVSVLLVGLAVRWARKRGRRGWVWGGATALVMYHLVFWDLIPTLVVHKYYCATQAGVWVYKSPEQWVQENPGVLETLSVSHLPEQYRVPNAVGARCGDMAILGSDGYYLLPDGTCLRANYDVRGKSTYVDFVSPDGSHGYQLNERIRRSKREGDDIPLIDMQIEEVVDFGTNTLLARFVGFRRGLAWPLAYSGDHRPRGGIGTHFFMGNTGCSMDDRNESRLRNFAHQFEKEIER